MKNTLDKIIEQLNNNSVIEIDLSYHKIGDKSAKRLAAALGEKHLVNYA